MLTPKIQFRFKSSSGEECIISSTSTSFLTGKESDVSQFLLRRHNFFEAFTHTPGVALPQINVGAGGSKWTVQSRNWDQKSGRVGLWSNALAFPGWNKIGVAGDLVVEKGPGKTSSSARAAKFAPCASLPNRVSPSSASPAPNATPKPMPNPTNEEAERPASSPVPPKKIPVAEVDPPRTPTPRRRPSDTERIPKTSKKPRKNPGSRTSPRPEITEQEEDPRLDPVPHRPIRPRQVLLPQRLPDDQVIIYPYVAPDQQQQIQPGDNGDERSGPKEKSTNQNDGEYFKDDGDLPVNTATE
jgi:hypothetical protein